MANARKGRFLGSIVAGSRLDGPLKDRDRVTAANSSKERSMSLDGDPDSQEKEPEEVRFPSYFIRYQVAGSRTEVDRFLMMS